MELQIQELVSSIRSEGLEKANKEASEILEKARKEGESIVSEAKAEAEKLRQSAEKDAEQFKTNAVLSAEQAKRDAILAFKAQVQAEFERILSAETGKAMDEHTLATLIAAALNDEDASNYTAEVAAVTEGLNRELASQIKNGLEIRPSKSVQAGFRLCAKDDSGFFDCTDEEIAKMLLPFFRNVQM